MLFSALKTRAARLSRCDGIVGAVMLRSFQPSLGQALSEAVKPDRWILKPVQGADWQAVDKEDGTEILLRPARQVATRERLELLGYFGEVMVADGMPLRETARALSNAGYAVALAWGRGKWLFKRAFCVRNFIVDHEMQKISRFICDSALRPWFWPEPLFALAKHCKFSIISGSDPLPGPGNECNAGRKAMSQMPNFVI